MKTWKEIFSTKKEFPKSIPIDGEEWTLEAGRWFCPGKQVYLTFDLWADGTPSECKVWVVGSGMAMRFNTPFNLTPNECFQTALHFAMKNMEDAVREHEARIVNIKHKMAELKYYEQQEQSS